MEATEEIRAKLPIEELVGQYCQLQKKGRNFVSLCPFHDDKRPSLLVSPDKGIAYCFACQTGGDIFSFYQAIEGVDFRQSLKDLAERTGVTIAAPTGPAVQKDEKDRYKECLEAALKFYQSQLKSSEKGKLYLETRHITPDLVKQFSIGLAPDSFSDTYQHLLKEGFSRKEIIGAGLGIQKELTDEKIYDRFRNRLVFPIFDYQGRIIGFGGRTLGEDDAKYINTAETPLYNKSTALYGYHLAKDAMRSTKGVVLVEGYFDVIACHRVGITNVVAVSGTALTEQHVKTLKRNCENVLLCLDQDRAGQDAAERSFQLCADENLNVHAVTLAHKDPDDAVNNDPATFKKTIDEGGVPYLELVLNQLSSLDLNSSDGKREVLQRFLPLLDRISLATEREHYLGKLAGMLGTTETALKEDLKKIPKQIIGTPSVSEVKETEQLAFSTTEIVLALFFLYPSLRNLMDEMIAPDEGFAGALYQAVKEAPDEKQLTLEMLNLPEEFNEKASILLLFCEHHSFTEWSEGLAAREIHGNCLRSNRELLKIKQQEIAQKLFEARKTGKTAEEAQLSTQFQQVLKLAKMASKE